MGKFDWLKDTPIFDMKRLGKKSGKIETDDGPIYVVPSSGGTTTSSSTSSGDYYPGTLGTVLGMSSGTTSGSSSDYRIHLAQQQQQSTMNEAEIRRLTDLMQQQQNVTYSWSGSTLDWRQTLMDGISGEAKDMLERELPRKGFDTRWSITLDPRQAVWSLVAWRDGSRPTESSFGAVTIPLMTEELMYDMATSSPRNLKAKIWDKVTERIRDWLDEQPDVVVTWEEPLYDLDGPVEVAVL